MYFVDRERIEKTLQFYEEQFLLFEKQPSWTTILEKKALERISQLIIEAILDVGNSMIDGFIMRDPGSYEDIIDILEDEKVINSKQANDYKVLIRLRKSLVQEYIDINHEELESIVKANIDSVKSFPQSVRNYLENELGPVSAFKN